MSEKGVNRTEVCPYCGELKSRHDYASRTSCVLGPEGLSPSGAAGGCTCDSPDPRCACLPGDGCACALSIWDASKGVKTLFGRWIGTPWWNFRFWLGMRVGGFTSAERNYERD